MPKVKRLNAHKTSKCSCGIWVYPGDKINYDFDQKKTVGCSYCNYTGHAPDSPDPPDMRWDGQ